MRTTLKRGIGRGAGVNGNGRAVLPPGALSPITIYRQPEPPPRSRWAFVRTALAWAGVALLVLIGSAAGGAYLWFHQSVADVRRIHAGSQDRGEAARRRAAARPARHGSRDRLRQARRRGQGDAVALRHDHARARRSGDEVDLDDVVPARPLRRDPLPGQAGLRRADQQRLRDVRHEGHARDRPQADRRCPSTT